MEGDLHQSGQKSVRVYRGDTGYRVGVQLAVADHPQAPLSLGHEHGPVRQEGEAPGIVELRGHYRDADIGLFSGMEQQWLIGQGHARHPAP